MCGQFRRTCPSAVVNTVLSGQNVVDAFSSFIPRNLKCRSRPLLPADDHQTLKRDYSPSPPSAMILLISPSFSTRATISAELSLNACNPAYSCCFCSKTC